jgi:hypothetical protein
LTRQIGVWLLLAGAALCSAQQGRERRESVPPLYRSLRLSLTIRADRQLYNLNDAVPLEVQLTNTGTGTLYLFDDVCWNPGNFLTLEVFTASGKEVSVPITYLRDCLPPPPRRNDTSRFFRLEPQTFYGVIEKYAVRELVAAPGEYDVVVHYEAGLSADWLAKYGGPTIAALPIWTREQPILTSNRLHISVKP